MPGERIKHSKFMQRCVADVTGQGKDAEAAFAICTAQSQRAGYSEPGSRKLTKKGKRRERQFAKEKDMGDKRAAYLAATGRAEEAVGVRKFKMDAETHEEVWGLGARAAREARGKLDVEGAFLAAVRKHGTKVFPAAAVREDDPWFEEYFRAFRDGAQSSQRAEEATTIRGMLALLEAGAVQEADEDVPPGFVEEPVTVTVKRVRYATRSEGGLEFQVGHAGDKVYDAYLKDRIASWSPGMEKSIAVLRKARYTDEEIQRVFDDARADDSFRGIELPRPVKATFTVLRRK